MGLDMFIYACPKDPRITVDETGINIPSDVEIPMEELAYWRKNHDLHGWMHRLHCEKFGDVPAEDFNCMLTLLSAEDIDKCLEDEKNYELPHTEGFFFGDNPPDPESMMQDSFVFLQIKEYMEQNPDNYVFYTSWW